MARKKTTVSIDEDLLRAAKVAAAREGKPDYLVFEEALRDHLGVNLIDRLRAGFTDLSLSEDEATQIAVRETRAARGELAKKRRRARG